MVVYLLSIKGGYIYLASNPAMPQYTKVGMCKEWPEKRLSGLFTTGVPLPFKLEYAAHVTDRRLVESFLHDTFADKRVVSVNPKTGRKIEREFFRIEPEIAVELAKQHLGNSLRIKAYKVKRSVGIRKWRKVKAWGIVVLILLVMSFTGAIEYLWWLTNRLL